MIFGDIIRMVRATASALEWWCRTAKMREIRKTRQSIEHLKNEINKANELGTPDGAELVLQLLSDIKQEKKYLEYISNTDV